jgi:hypothetical protein
MRPIAIPPYTLFQNLEVGSWHKVRAQPEAYEGTETTALPTLGHECRPTG